MRMAVRMALAGLGLLATGVNVRGQTPGTPPAASPNPQKDQDANEITAVPNRPTFASTAEMVQFGVFEIEYGLEAAKGHQNINGLLKWGAVKNLELWFLHNPIERDAGTAGLGDSGAGFKYKLFPQMKARPTAAILYLATLPTARPELGAGAMAHLVQFLVSKDLGKHHFDVKVMLAKILAHQELHQVGHRSGAELGPGCWQCRQVENRRGGARLHLRK